MIISRSVFRRLGIALLTSLPICHAAAVPAQEAKDKWQRVYTGEDYVTEVNVSNPKFEPNQIFRVEFRTVFSKPEKLDARSDTRYKSRLETIDFKLNEKRYRLYESKMLAANGKELSAYQATTEDWRVIKPGGAMERLFNSARALPPFGSWKAVSYRFAEGGNNKTANAADLERLLGTQVSLASDQAAVGTKICSFPNYEDKRVTREQFSRDFGVDATTIGINAEVLETISVKCSGSGWTPPQSLLVKGNGEELLMLWDGVFLVLKKEGNWNRYGLPTLKAKLPVKESRP